MKLSTTLSSILLVAATSSAIINDPQEAHSPAVRYPSIDFRSATVPAAELEKRKGGKGGSGGGSSAAVRIGDGGLMMKLGLGVVGGGLMLQLL